MKLSEKIYVAHVSITESDKAPLSMVTTYTLKLFLNSLY